MTEFNPYQHFGFLTHRVARLIDLAITPKLKAAGYHFPPSCIGILADLWQSDGLSQRELGISLIKTKSSINKMLASLIEDEMITKKTDPQDKRNKRIYLTDRGRKFKARVEDASKAMEEALLSNIPSEQVQTAKTVLKSLYQNLTSEQAKPLSND